MRRHAEAGHVDADHADAVDLVGQQLERHARRGRHAQVGDDDRVVERGSASSWTASRMSSNSLPVTSVSELKGT
jgi:hypothetical protein